MKAEWRWARWVPEIVLLAATTAAGFYGRGRWVDPVGDPGTWWSAVYRLSGGERLYRDVYLQFGPLSPYLLSLGARLVGTSATYMLVVTWAAAILAALLLVRISRPLLSVVERIAMVGVLLGIALFAPGPARLVFPYAPGAVHALCLSFAALLLLVVERPGPESRAWLAGGLAGAAFCAKQEIGVACGLALVAAVLIHETGRGRLLGRLLLGCVGVAALGTVALLGVSFESLREQSRVWPLSMVPPGNWEVLYARVAGIAAPDWKVTLQASSWLLLSCVAVIALLALAFSRERRLSRWLPTGLLLGVVVAWEIVEAFGFRNARLITLFMLVGFLVAFLAVVQKQLPHRPAMVAIGLFAGLIGSRAAFSTDLGGPYAGVAHLTSALTWVIFVCICVPRILLGGEKSRVYARRITATACLAVGWASAAVGFSSLSSPEKQEVETRAGCVFVSRDLAPFFRRIIRHVRPGERILVLPEINGLDALLRASDASPYPTHMPGWLDERSELQLLHRLNANPPDVVVVFNRSTFEYGVRPFGDGYDRLLSRWIDQRYENVDQMPAGRILRPRQTSRQWSDQLHRRDRVRVAIGT
jgi:hypothetical protein